MWVAPGFVTGVSNSQIDYGAFTSAGMAGAPVLMEAGSQMNIVAVHAYGSAWGDVHAYCARDNAGRALVADGLPYRMGELRWAMDREMACTLGDLLIRRTHVAYETRHNGRSGARSVAEGLGMPATEVERYDAEVSRIFAIDG